jgi:cytochrome d ubiquinol oxidase subunit II
MSAALFDFVPVWTLIMAAGLFFYVLLDGFDLGVGIFYGFMPDARSRNTVMSAIAPVWDGNETWLVLGGRRSVGGVSTGFRDLIPALYFPIAIMLLALVFRGVAFEFRFRDAEHRTFWDHGFFYGSLAATVAQGVMLGAFIQGFRVDGRVFSGSAFDFLTPFSILTGIALVFGYGLLGAGWLVLKTEGEIQERARRYGLLSLAGVLVAILLVSVWTPSMSEQISRRWFSWPNILLLSPVPIATALVAFGTWRALSGTSQSGAFIGAVGLFALSYAGIAIACGP